MCVFLAVCFTSVAEYGFFSKPFAVQSESSLSRRGTLPVVITAVAVKGLLVVFEPAVLAVVLIHITLLDNTSC